MKGEVDFVPGRVHRIDGAGALHMGLARNAICIAPEAAAARGRP